MLYLGIDLHGKQFTVCLRDDAGSVAMRRQVTTFTDASAINENRYRLTIATEVATGSRIAKVHRARGPLELPLEQPKSVNEGEDVENPKDERAPVQRFLNTGLELRLVPREVKSLSVTPGSVRLSGHAGTPARRR